MQRGRGVLNDTKAIFCFKSNIWSGVDAPGRCEETALHVNRTSSAGPLYFSLDPNNTVSGLGNIYELADKGHKASGSWGSFHRPSENVAADAKTAYMILRSTPYIITIRPSIGTNSSLMRGPPLLIGTESLLRPGALFLCGRK